MPGNCHRDLLKSFAGKATVPVGSVTLQLLHKTGIAGPRPVSVIWPHEMFAYLYAAKPATFAKHILGGAEDRPGSFWEAMRGTPKMLARTELLGKDLTRTIPLALHGDGVAYCQVGRVGSKTLDMLSWASLLAVGPTRETNFLLTGLPKHVVKSQGVGQSWKVFWLRLLWSLRCLEDGTWPGTDHLGRPWPDGSAEQDKAGTYLAGGYSAFIWVLRGDLEFMSQHFKLPNPNSRTPCALCQADRIQDPSVKARPSKSPAA